jgi:cyanophycinase-like exopeptidase
MFHLLAFLNRLIGNHLAHNLLYGPRLLFHVVTEASVMNEMQPLSMPVASAPTRQICQGPVMPIGGAEETEPGGEILERFVTLAGGDNARIAVIPTASGDPKRSGEGYVELFYELGVKEADWLRVDQRPQANADKAVEMLGQASGIFITGGDQSRLIEILGGTRAMEQIRHCNAKGIVVAGTSAGASILPALMMAGVPVAVVTLMMPPRARGWSN